MRKLAKELNVARETVRCIITKTFELLPFKLLRAQTLSDRQKLGRWQKSKALMRRFCKGRHRQVFFTGEKSSTYGAFSSLSLLVNASTFQTVSTKDLGRNNTGGVDKDSRQFS